MNSYEKGKRWGYAVFKRNCEFYGEVGIGKSDKASITCSKYLETNRRRGKKLSKADRDFYAGAVEGFQEFYTKNIFKHK